MPDQQIQTVRSRDYQITSRTRPRGLWGQVSAVVLQPGRFFESLPKLADTRSWLWAAILILALTAISAVRQESLLNAPVGGGQTIDFGGAPPGTDLGGDLGSSPSGRPIDIEPVGVVDPGIPTGELPAGDAPNVTSTWTTALLTAAGIIVGWFVLTLLLSEVTLFNGRAPIFGHNLQVAIWATIPLALLAVLQLIYYSVGGTVGEGGLSGFLADWQAYQDMSSLTRSLLLSLTSRLTLFWIWSLILIYVGARKALKGKWYAAMLVVAAWVAVLVVVPVVTGAVKAPNVVSENSLPELITDPSLSSEGGMPEGLDDPFAPESQGEAVDIQSGDESSVEVTGEAGSEGDAPRRPTSVPPEGENAVNEGQSQNSESGVTEGQTQNTQPSVIQGQSQNVEPAEGQSQNAAPAEGQSENAEPTAIPSNKGL